MGQEGIGFAIALSLFTFWSAWTGRLGVLGARQRLQSESPNSPKTPEDLIKWVERYGPITETLRKEGLLAFEGYRAKIQDPLLQRGLKWLAEGFEFAVVEEWLGGEAQRLRANATRAERDFETLFEFGVASVIVGAGVARALASGVVGSWMGASWAGLPTLVFGVAGLLWLASDRRAKFRDAQEVRERHLVLVRLVVKGVSHGQAGAPLLELARIRVQPDNGPRA
jgi:flagellar motor component MotA